MNTTVQLDASNRIVLSRELRRAAAIPRRQTLNASVTPGRIVLEVPEYSAGKIVRKGRLKVWLGVTPPTPIADAVATVRDYQR